VSDQNLKEDIIHNSIPDHISQFCNNYRFLLFGEDVEKGLLHFQVVLTAQREDAST